jgi:hypothetical protein
VTGIVDGEDLWRRVASTLLGRKGQIDWIHADSWAACDGIA